MTRFPFNFILSIVFLFLLWFIIHLFLLSIPNAFLWIQAYFILENFLYTFQVLINFLPTLEHYNRFFFQIQFRRFCHLYCSYFLYSTFFISLQVSFFKSEFIPVHLLWETSCISFKNMLIWFFVNIIPTSLSFILYSSCYQLASSFVSKLISSYC